MKRVYDKRFNIHGHGYWGRGAETPEALAARFVGMIDRLREVKPVFDLWTCVSKHPEKFEAVRDHYMRLKWPMA